MLLAFELHQTRLYWQLTEMISEMKGILEEVNRPITTRSIKKNRNSHIIAVDAIGAGVVLKV